MEREPGWYPDPADPELRERYWLGDTWSEDRVRLATRAVTSALLRPENDDEENDLSETDEAQLALDQASISRHALTLGGVGLILEVVAVLAALGALITGIVLPAHKTTDEFGNSSHPDVSAGVSLIVAAVVGGLIYWALARALRLFAEHASFQARAQYRLLDSRINGRTARGKECPDCFEDVWNEARVCPFCSHRFDAG